MHLLIAAIVGLISGLISGLFGVGGGIVMVPAMVYAMKLDIKIAIGTSLAVIIPTALITTFKHHSMHQVNWPVALSIMPLAIFGGYFGAALTHKIASADLKRAFGAFLILVGCRLLFFK